VHWTLIYVLLVAAVIAATVLFVWPSTSWLGWAAIVAGSAALAWLARRAHAGRVDPPAAPSPLPVARDAAG
jgi:hypothetical protein